MGNSQSSNDMRPDEVNLDEEFGPEIPDKVEVVNFPQTEKIGGLISDLKAAIEAIETNVSVNVGTSELAEVVKSLEAWQITTVEAINAIPQPVEPKDYTKNLEEIKKALKKDVDFAPVVAALSRLEARETKVEVPGFTELKEAIASVGEKIDNIKGFEIPEKLIYKDQLKVSVDRIGGGGGIVDTSSLATETTQEEIVVNQETLISLIQTLQETNHRLSFLAGMANGGAVALRTIPIASVSTAVTGTVTATVTNFGTGIPASEMAHDINNQTAVLANINNVTP